MSWLIKKKLDKTLIGAKAKHLFELQSEGFNVPKFVVIPFSFFKSESTNKFKDILTEIDLSFKPNTKFAVRSSSSQEDGGLHSFAGQFETFLNVPYKDLEDKIMSVFKSVNSDRVKTYKTVNGLGNSSEIAVIIQEMVEADFSLVAFSKNPNDIKADEKIINATYGLGEGLVSGDLLADSYHIVNGTVQSKIAAKIHKYVSGEVGVSKVEVEESLRDKSTLTNTQVIEIVEALDKSEKYFGAPQDMELSYQNNKLYFLQSRPITVNQSKSKGEYTLWDNSNIIESYPGITSPLTFTFIEKMYSKVYSQLAQVMGVSKRQVEEQKHVFDNTLGLVNGRVYYNLLSWYKMLAMVPGYSLNARFMEQMMGVKERFDLTENYKMNKVVAWFRTFGMVFKMIGLQISLPKDRIRFTKFVSGVFKEYQNYDYKSMSDSQMIQKYLKLEDILLNSWKAPLVNDFFTMIWFGVLEKKVKKIAPEHPNIHNDILCGSHNIISVEPLHRSFKIVEKIKETPEALELFKTKESLDILKGLKAFESINTEINNYIKTFGDRCIGELKLENTSFSQKPEEYIEVLKAYIREDVKINNNNIEARLRDSAASIIDQKLKGKFLKKKMFNFVLKNARAHVSGRENLRFERTKAFGLVRKIMLHIGENLKGAGTINEVKDIFYLELNEILNLENQKGEFIALIEERKLKYQKFKSKDVPVERFCSFGKVFSDEFIYATDKLEPITGDLSGVGCCPGRITGKVRVVKDPKEIKTLNGDILVTTSTDPGWITLFPSASAIVVERGSLLSHSAIVSREMGIPCIVGVSGLLRTLKTGDKIQLDGSTGEIKILSGNHA